MIWKMVFIILAIERVLPILGKMIHVSHGDETGRCQAQQHLGDRIFGTSEGIIWNKKFLSPMTIIVTDILHPVYSSMARHLID